jgi:hypothetical protein
MKTNAVARLEGTRGAFEQLKGAVDQLGGNQRVLQAEDVAAVEGGAFQPL